MKTLITSFLLLFQCVGSFAQKTPEMIKGNIYSDSKWTYVNSVFGNDETGYYTFSDMKFKERIEKYDKQFNKLITVKPELNDEKYKDRKDDYTFFYAGKIFVASSSIEKKSGIQSFFIETLNNNTLLSNNDVVKVCEFPKSNLTFSSVVLSEDQSKVLFLRAQNSDATGNKLYGVGVYDCKESKTLFTENILLPFSESKINFIEAFVGNSGNCYLYYHLYEYETSISVENSPYNGHLFCLFDLGKIKNDFLIPMTNMKPGIIKIAEKASGDLFIAGYYSVDTIGNINGSFSTVINKSGKSGDVKTVAMTKISKSTKIDHLLSLKDGSFVLIGEATNHSHHKTSARDWSMGSPASYNSPVNPITGNREGNASTIHDMAMTSNSYFNGDIVIVKYNNTGEPAWNKTIKKNQYFTVPGEYGFAYLMYASYGVMESSDKIHLIFNDHINNVQKKDEVMTDEFQRKAESALIEVSINVTDGFYTKAVLQKSKENKVLFRPGGSKQVSENELVMFGSSDDDHQGMKIKF